MALFLENKIVTVIGGSGFVGRHIVQRLAQHAALIKVGCRHTQQAMALLPMGMVGQIKLVPTNIRDEEGLRALIKGSDIVINLVGILHEKGPQTFADVHTQAAVAVAKICQEENVQTLIHFSALGVSLSASSAYARTKAEAEQLVRQQFNQAIIVRPSLIFGAEDRFFNKFAYLATVFPCFPLFYKGKTRFQPVFVGDVAEAVIQALLKKYPPEIIELAGPTIYTFKELLQMMGKILRRRLFFFPLPAFIGRLIGRLVQYMPHPFLTGDQVDLLKIDSVSSHQYAGFKELGIMPKNLETLLPPYLKRFIKE